MKLQSEGCTFGASGVAMAATCITWRTGSKKTLCAPRVATTCATWPVIDNKNLKKHHVTRAGSLGPPWNDCSRQLVARAGVVAIALLVTVRVSLQRVPRQSEPQHSGWAVVGDYSRVPHAVLLDDDFDAHADAHWCP